jgi:hypothetical protein
MLCDRCQRFNIQAFAVNPYPYRGILLRDIIRSVTEEHCSFCSLLLEHAAHSSIFYNVPAGINSHKKHQDINWLSVEPLQWLYQQTKPLPWVDLSISQSPGQSNTESSGLHIISIDAWLQGLSRQKDRPVIFHAAADLGGPPPNPNSVR